MISLRILSSSRRGSNRRSMEIMSMSRIRLLITENEHGGAEYYDNHFEKNDTSL